MSRQIASTMYVRITVPDPGLIVLGKVKAGIDALNVSGTIEATIELDRAVM